MVVDLGFCELEFTQSSRVVTSGVDKSLVWAPGTSRLFALVISFPIEFTSHGYLDHLDTFFVHM